MALDDLACDVERLYTVGINGALSQPFGTCLFLGLGIEHLNKIPTDDLTLLFWIGDTGKVGKEFR